MEWIAAAVAQYQINIPENQLLGLLHALTATKGVPDWVGIREPVSPEANLLSISDRLSGQDDFLSKPCLQRRALDVITDICAADRSWSLDAR